MDSHQNKTFPPLMYWRSRVGMSSDGVYGSAWCVFHGQWDREDSGEMGKRCHRMFMD